MDASGRLSLEKQFYGCFVPRLYNHGRPHSALGPGIPADTKARLRRFSPHTRRHELPADSRITTREILGGLHHEYELARIAA